MYYYEILNRETLEKAQGQAKSMRAMCESLNWRPQDCKCIYRAPAVQPGYLLRKRMRTYVHICELRTGALVR